MNKGVLVVVAAGNNSSNNDRKKFFPATSNVENILAVAASSNEAGAKASFSNFGKTTVEVAAPGGSIRSTSPSSSQKARYRTLSGTSMASPHVAGIAALVWSRHPAMDWAQVKETVVGTVKFNKNWATKVSSAGVANALNAVSQ
jgi:subtilisin family serine protease